jgi:hypothetical protein
MIASILIAVSAGITLIIQSIALARCRALKCVRDKPDVDTEVELTPKGNRPRLQTITNDSIYDDEEEL